MDPQTKAEFEKLLSKSANKTCIDCDQFNPQWASVNNGCFMCIKCSGNHRSMGVHISFVRSVTMDKWSKIQLARMKHGGNGKLKKFWAQQKFPKNLTPKQRLNNNAMDKYKERLLSLAKGEQPDDIPFIGYQERPDNNSYSNLNNINSANSSSSSLHSNGSNNNNDNKYNGNRPKMQGFGNTPYNPNDNQQKDTSWDDFWNSASSLASKTTAAASDFAQKAKVNAVSLGNKAAEKTSAIKTKLGDEEYQANIKKNAAETWNKTTNTISSWWNTAATSVTNVINENFVENNNKEGIKLYNKDGVDINGNNNNGNDQNNGKNRKKMAALSSDQYFNKNSQQNVKAYGSATNDNNENKEIPKQKEEDILGMNIDKNKKKHIDNLKAWNSNKKKKKPQNKKQQSDDFDDWGFGDDEDEDEDVENDEKHNNEKPEIKPILDITEAINGNNNNKDKVESLLDFDKNDNIKKQKEKDGNSSDELDAFFNEMELETEEDKKGDNNNNNNNKKQSNKNDDDINDLLTSHNKNKDDVGDDEWGW